MIYIYKFYTSNYTILHIEISSPDSKYTVSCTMYMCNNNITHVHNNSYYKKQNRSAVVENFEFTFYTYM